MIARLLRKLANFPDNSLTLRPLAWNAALAQAISYA
jgi:hypothetical protein